MSTFLFDKIMNLRYIIFIYFFSLSWPSAFSQISEEIGSATVDSLNKLGYDIRLADPEKTLQYASKALSIAKKTNYLNGIAEAHRISGIGNYYVGKHDRAISNYLISLKYFEQTNNLAGQAKIHNNIGNIYKDISYDKALQYFQQSLQIAQQLELQDLVAAAYLNIGIIHYRQEKFNTALKSSLHSYRVFTQLNNTVGITLSLQNLGVIYFRIHQPERAEKLLLKANKMAKNVNLSTAVASINLTLVSIYINKKDFEKAYYYLNEGRVNAIAGKSAKLQSDILKSSYLLEVQRNDYKKALNYLQKLYTQDSIDLQNTISKKFGLFEEQSKTLEKEKNTAIKLAQAEKKLILFWSSIVVSVLALIIIFILYLVGKKKARTNKQLKILNEQISLQTAYLNKVNQNLEEIISERTKDLQIKNRKLSEYSSHLSHQIRSPVSTMKGLMILEKENLIDPSEFVEEISKCVNELDDKIIHINEVLNDLSESGLIPKLVDKETGR